VTSHMLALVPAACPVPGAVLVHPGASGHATGRIRYIHRTAIIAAARSSCGKSITVAAPRTAPSKR
jgi:hypothetical protein